MQDDNSAAYRKKVLKLPKRKLRPLGRHILRVFMKNPSFDPSKTSEEEFYKNATLWFLYQIPKLIQIPQLNKRFPDLKTITDTLIYAYEQEGKVQRMQAYFSIEEERIDTRILESLIKEEGIEIDTSTEKGLKLYEYLKLPLRRNPLVPEKLLEQISYDNNQETKKAMKRWYNNYLSFKKEHQI